MHEANRKAIFDQRWAHSRAARVLQTSATTSARRRRWSATADVIVQTFPSGSTATRMR